MTLLVVVVVVVMWQAICERPSSASEYVRLLSLTGIWVTSTGVFLTGLQAFTSWVGVFWWPHAICLSCWSSSVRWFATMKGTSAK